MKNYKEMREESSDTLKFSWGNDENTLQYPLCYWSKVHNQQGYLFTSGCSAISRVNQVFLRNLVLCPRQGFKSGIRVVNYWSALWCFVHLRFLHEYVAGC